MKVNRRSDISIDSFGGLVFFDRFMDHPLIKKPIESVFGQRAAQAQYSYRDVLQTFCSNSLSGGCFLEDINHLRTVTPSESIKYSSSDVVSDVMGHLTEFDSSGSTDKHDLYFNRQSNELLIRLYKQFHYKDTDQLNILDQDHTLIEHQKSDARPSYKGSGYWCNVMAVGDQPVYISLQGGNSTPSSELPTVLKRGFEQLSDQDLTFDCYRADGASYSENVLEVVDEYFDDFLVRSRISQKRIESVIQRGGFKTCVLNNNKSVQVAELNDQFANIDCRRILYRYRAGADEKDLFSQEYVNFEIITTLGEEYSAEDLINLYNQRGRAEQLIYRIKNEFNGLNCPFLEAPYNLTWMCFCAVNVVLVDAFQHHMEQLSDGWIRHTDRLKRLIRRLIAIPARRVSTGHTVRYDLYSKIPDLDPLIRWVNG